MQTSLHDSAGRLVRVEDWTGETTVYTHAAAGKMVRVQSVTTTVVYT